MGNCSPLIGAEGCGGNGELSGVFNITGRVAVNNGTPGDGLASACGCGCGARVAAAGRSDGEHALVKININANSCPKV